jgi:hypothetical protein
MSYFIEDEIEYLYDIGYEWYEIADYLYLSDTFVVDVITDYIYYKWCVRYYYGY